MSSNHNILTDTSSLLMASFPQLQCKHCPSGKRSGVRTTQEVQVQGPNLDAEPELLVGHLQAPRVVLKLPGLLQVLLHSPDVINGGLEDGALVPAHVPASPQNERSMFRMAKYLPCTRWVEVKPCFGFRSQCLLSQPTNPRASQPLFVQEANLHVHRTGSPR